jgi:hypothetical protein
VDSYLRKPKGQLEMVKEAETTFHEKYVLITVIGDPRLPQEIQSLLTTAVEQANESNLNIVIHRELPVKQIASTIDFYQYAVSLGKSRFRNKLALVFPEEMHHDNLDFFETTSRNRGINFKLFSKLEEALSWIGVTE